jgi:cell division protein FtsW (lipid II flippase)
MIFTLSHQVPPIKKRNGLWNSLKWLFLIHIPLFFVLFYENMFIAFHYYSTYLFVALCVGLLFRYFHLCIVFSVLCGLCVCLVHFGAVIKFLMFKKKISLLLNMFQYKKVYLFTKGSKGCAKRAITHKIKFLRTPIKLFFP